MGRGSESSGKMLSLDGLDGVNGKEEVQEGGDIYIHVADSHCMAEANTIL